MRLLNFASKKIEIAMLVSDNEYLHCILYQLDTISTDAQIVICLHIKSCIVKSRRRIAVYLWYV